MRTYVAGPMSGLPSLNFPAFHAEASRLRAQGHEVVNPAEINVDPNAGWAACMKADIAQLVTCDAIRLLPGWERSRGALIEFNLACQLGMHVSAAPCASVLQPFDEPVAVLVVGGAVHEPHGAVAVE